MTRWQSASGAEKKMMCNKNKKINEKFSELLCDYFVSHHIFKTVFSEEELVDTWLMHYEWLIYLFYLFHSKCDKYQSQCGVFLFDFSPSGVLIFPTQPKIHTLRFMMAKATPQERKQTLCCWCWLEADSPIQVDWIYFKSHRRSLQHLSQLSFVVFLPFWAFSFKSNTLASHDSKNSRKNKYINK